MREWLEFIAAGGYRDPKYWLADGWQRACDEGWTAPLYWEQRDGEWYTMTLAGLQPLDLAAPVCHVSYYEADAFARFRGRAPADRSRMGACRSPGARSPAISATAGYLRPIASDGCADVRRCLGMDGQRLSALSGLSRLARRGGRIQRQVHDQSDGAARRLLRHAARSHPRHLPQFLLSAPALAVHGPAAGRTMPRKPKRVSPPTDSVFLRDVWNGLAKPQKTLPSKYFYDGTGSAPVRGDLRAAGILPDPHRAWHCCAG